MSKFQGQATLSHKLAFHSTAFNKGKLKSFSFSRVCHNRPTKANLNHFHAISIQVSSATCVIAFSNIDGFVRDYCSCTYLADSTIISTARRLFPHSNVPNCAKVRLRVKSFLRFCHQRWNRYCYIVHAHICISVPSQGGFRQYSIISVHRNLSRCRGSQKLLIGWDAIILNLGKYSHTSAVTADAKQWGGIRNFAILSRYHS